MKIQVISDVHAEFHADLGQNFWTSMPVKGDVLVIAGDLGTSSCINDNLCWAAEKFPHVVYVPGNHDYWGAPGYRTVKAAIEAAVKKHPNIHWLFDSAVEIDGQRFIGNTMWFPLTDNTHMHEHQWSDFKRIKRGRQWIYKANKTTQRYLNDEVRKGDVVVTHHLPCDLSIADRFRTGPNAWQNGFYFCDMSDLILDNKPACWIHGHSHDFNDYMLGETRIVSNPYGYQGYEPVLTRNLSFCVEV